MSDSTTPKDPAPDPAPAPPVPPAPPAPAPLSPWNWQRFVPTNWQSIASTLAIIAVTILLNRLGFTPAPLPVPDPPVPIWQGEFGWHEPTEADKAAAAGAPNVFQFAQTEAAQWDPVGDPDGNAFIYQLANKGYHGTLPTLNQGGVGSCVGHGWAWGINAEVCLQAGTNRGPPIDGGVLIPAEVVYGGSRVNANGGRAPLLGDGSNGSWAAKFVTDVGVCSRGVYGSDDVSKYSESNCRALGRSGIKGELLAACQKNKVSAALVSSAADIEKALKQGYFVPICSNVGFAGQSSRDADGFLKARGVWPHCMCVIAYRADKKGFLIINSWGPNWVSGPKYPADQPDGSFWITTADMERIAKQGDSYAVSAVRGFPKKKINADDWIVARPRKIDLPPLGRLFDPLFALTP